MCVEVIVDVGMVVVMCVWVVACVGIVVLVFCLWVVRVVVCRGSGCAGGMCMYGTVCRGDGRGKGMYMGDSE